MDSFQDTNTLSPTLEKRESPLPSGADGISEQRGQWWLWLACILGVLFMMPEVITRPLFGDNSYYLWAAKQINNGIYPIRDFFAIDPAGAMAYFCLVRRIFGESSIGYWAMAIVNVVATAWLVGQVAKRSSGLAAASLWSVLLFAAYQFRCVRPDSLVGKDMLAYPFILGGLMLAGENGWWLLGHLLVGVGLAIKPTLGLIWMVWMLGSLVLSRNDVQKWLVRALASGVLIAIPFLLATLWAERNGWGWSALKVNAGLRGGNYGVYLSGDTIYKLIHIFAVMLWLMPLAYAGFDLLRPFTLSRHLLLLSVILGGLMNWAMQPMFNVWYFTAFVSGAVALAGIAVATFLGRLDRQLCALIAVGLLSALVPSTNLRWLKFLTDIKGKQRYSLAEHQDRIYAQLSVGNTPVHIQQWLAREVGKLAKPGSRVGVTITDGNVLYGLREYPPGFWAVWCPSWNPKQLVNGIVSGRSDVIIGLDEPSPEEAVCPYSYPIAKLRWEMPEKAVSALKEAYEPVVRGYGYVIYRKRE